MNKNVYKIWVDDVRPAPEGYWLCTSVNMAKEFIKAIESYNDTCRSFNLSTRDIVVIDIDHDAGIYAEDGGDYIKLLDWLEETGKNYPIRIHSANAVGVQNMRRIIQKNGWTEIKELI